MRAELEVEDLLKVVLVLVVVWLALAILRGIVGTTLEILELLEPFIALIAAALIVLWLLDRL
jgi:hypothetical protein